MLGFAAPPGKAPLAWRTLKVEVRREGLKVRARRGYTLRAATRGTERPEAAKEKTRKLPEVVERALDSAHEAAGIPLRAMAYVFEPRPKETVRVLVVAEFDAGRLTFQGEGKARAARLEVTVAATHRDTGRTVYSDERVEVRAPEGASAGWRSVAREIELPAGVAQARVVVRDPASGVLGAVSQRFEVPRGNALRLSTPIVTDQIVREGAQARPRAALAAHRTFPPRGTLYCEFEVFGAKRDPGDGAPHVSAGLEVRASDGRLVREAPPTRIVADRDGRVVRLTGLGLDGMADGAYELSLRVRDDVSGGVLEKHEPFRIAP
jgi:hypothetical protein